jgi:hypothetical protein
MCRCSRPFSILGRKRLIGGPQQQHQPQRLLADDQPRPSDVARRITHQPGRQRDVAGGPDPDRAAGDRRFERLEAKTVRRQIVGPDSPVTGDFQAVARIEQQHGHVGREQLGHFDGGALDRGVEVAVVTQNRDHLGQPGGPHQRPGGVPLGALQALGKGLILCHQALYCFGMG